MSNLIYEQKHLHFYTFLFIAIEAFTLKKSENNFKTSVFANGEVVDYFFPRMYM